MANPFTYAAPVSGRDFCDRVDVVNRALAGLRDGRTVAAGGVIGSGASSLARQVQEELRRAGEHVVRAALWEVEDDRSAARVLRAALEAAPPRAGPGQEPEGDGPDGRPPAGAGPRALLQPLASDPAGSALLLDDAGKLAQAECPETTEAVRAVATGQAGLGLFGTGAFRPDRAGGWREEGTEASVVELGPIPLEAWLPYALERFLETDTWVGNEHVEEVVRTAGGHPRRTQELLATLWELAHPAGEVEDGHPDLALRLVLERRGPTHRALWETLTANQRRTLLGLALEGGRARPYSSEFVGRYGLAAASSVQRAVETLRDRGLLAPSGEPPPGSAPPASAEGRGGSGEADAPRLSDPFLARWLRRCSVQTTTATGR